MIVASIVTAAAQLVCGGAGALFLSVLAWVVADGLLHRLSGPDRKGDS